MSKERINRLADAMSECADLREQLDGEQSARAQLVELLAQALATASSAHRGVSEVNNLARGLGAIARKHGAGADLPERK